MRKMVWTTFDEKDETYRELMKLFKEKAKTHLENGRMPKFSEFVREVIRNGIKEMKKRKN